MVNHQLSLQGDTRHADEVRSACVPHTDTGQGCRDVPEPGGWRGREVVGRQTPAGESGRLRGQSGAQESWARWFGAVGGQGRGCDVFIATAL